MAVTLFGLEIYTRGAERLLEDLQQKPGKINIISGNAEVLKAPLNDKNVFRRFAGPGNIIIPDGISVLYPIRRKDKTARKIPGVEFMQTLLENFQGTDKSAYFLGAKDAVLQALIPGSGNATPA
jgi:UDP-N-acetyl-D-mannosaminuronic acid transferase (WecB/TagA/CpsF family)